MMTQADARMAATLNGSNGTPSPRWLKAFSTSGNSRSTAAPSTENTMPATASPRVEGFASRGTGGRSSSEPIMDTSTSMPLREKTANSTVTNENANERAAIQLPTPSTACRARLSPGSTSIDRMPATAMPPVTQMRTSFSTAMYWE